MEIQVTNFWGLVQFAFFMVLCFELVSTKPPKRQYGNRKRNMRAHDEGGYYD